jgi:hypothetical protein
MWYPKKYIFIFFIGSAVLLHHVSCQNSPRLAQTATPEQLKNRELSFSIGYVSPHARVAYFPDQFALSYFPCEKLADHDRLSFQAGNHSTCSAP